MKQATWEKLNTRLFLLRLFPEEITIWDDLIIPYYSKGIRFIQYLLKNGISLNRIQINDWNGSIPKIYVDGWQYERMSQYDLDRALIRAKEKLN